MTLEVELKFRVADRDALLRGLAALGVVPGAPVRQVDRYFNHPARDFAATDEAFRIRTVGDRHLLTYKGPKLDLRTKTRREIETPLDPADPRAEPKIRETLLALGFREVGCVEKHRAAGHLAHGGRDVEILLDEVADLGTFAEIETLADEAEQEAAKEVVLEVARRLGLTDPIRRSYLALRLGAAEPGA